MSLHAIVFAIFDIGTSHVSLQVHKIKFLKF